MQWTCDKCGKTMRISAEQLAETEGNVVCPQCLHTDVVPGYQHASRKSAPPAAPAVPPARRQQPATPKKPTPPPPHRKPINFVDRGSNAQTAQQPQAPAPRPKKKSKKKKKNKGCLAPPSSLGCLWRSVLYTLLLLLLYSLLGSLLQCS